MSQTFVLLGLFILFKPLDWAGWMCVFWLICPVCRRCVRWWPSIFMATVFFHLISSLPSAPPPPPLHSNHYSNKRDRLSAMQWKGSTCNAKMLFFFVSVVTGEMMGGKLDWKSGKKGNNYKEKKKAAIHPRQQSSVISAVISVRCK